MTCEWSKAGGYAIIAACPLLSKSVCFRRACLGLLQQEAQATRALERSQRFLYEAGHRPRLECDRIGINAGQGEVREREKIGGTEQRAKHAGAWHSLEVFASPRPASISPVLFFRVCPGWKARLSLSQDDSPEAREACCGCPVLNLQLLTRKRDASWRRLCPKHVEYIRG